MALVNDALARLESLPMARQRALARLLATRGSEFGVYPLSAAQRRMWFMAKVHQGVPLYNVAYGFAIEGPLDTGLLAEAIEALSVRHESLRTAFVEVDGEPFQTVDPQARLATTVSAWSGRGDVGTVVRALLDAEARRPFALSRAPLARSVVVRLGEADFLLLLTLHHIVCDGWSMAILLNELGELYTAWLRGGEPRLPALRCRYVDYARSRAQPVGQGQSEDLSYWARQLRGAPLRMELPADRPGPTAAPLAGAVEEFQWPRSLADRLEEFCQREGVTLFVAALAALDVVLHQWTGQDDLIVGVPVAGRGHADLQGVVGVFINTVLLRSRLRSGMAFRELVDRVSAVSLGALAHQELPFDELVQALAPERGPVAQAPFAVCFALQDPDSIVLSLPGVRTRYLQGNTGTAKFDLTISLWPTARGLSGVCEYRAALFEQRTIRRLVDHFRAVLTQAVGDPQAPVGQLAARRRRQDSAPGD